MNFNKTHENNMHHSCVQEVTNFINEKLENQNVPVEFPEEVLNLSQRDFLEDDSHVRKDYRSLSCLTIDCDDTQDMDDACSLVKTKRGYQLGVHIADVASFVKLGSVLDETARFRGSSIYLTGKTIPMLPSLLSDDLCSLNANEDRRAVSAFIDLSQDGEVEGYRIERTLIRSALKGSYSEVNSLVGQTAAPSVQAKYEPVLEMITMMAKVAGILRIKRMKEGARFYNTATSKIVLEDGRIKLTRNERGVAEKTIEEFMVVFNTIIAEYLDEHNLPSIYRYQDREGVLAGYKESSRKHASLGLDRYVHASSPIRRLADLRTMQCLSDHLEGISNEELHCRYDDVMANDSIIAEKRFRRARELQISCVKFCQKVYFNSHADEFFKGRIVGLDYRGWPLIEIPELGVRVKANKNIVKYQGGTVAFKVSPSSQKNELFAAAVHRVAA